MLDYIYDFVCYKSTIMNYALAGLWLVTLPNCSISLRALINHAQVEVSHWLSLSSRSLIFSCFSSLTVFSPFYFTRDATHGHVGHRRFSVSEFKPPLGL